MDIVQQKDSVLSNLVKSLAEPKGFYGSFFDTAKGWFIPLLLVVLSVMAIQHCYLSALSQEAWIEFNVRGMELEKRAQTIQALSQMSMDQMLIGALISLPIALTVIYLLTSAFLLLVNRSSGTTQRSFGSWFSLVAWSSLPALIIALVSIINLLTVADINTLAPEMISITNVSGLFGFDPTSTAFKLTQNFDLISLWSVALLAIALKSNGHTNVGAIGVALAPTVIMFAFTFLLI